jgi:hypothetical protein
MDVSPPLQTAAGAGSDSDRSTDVSVESIDREGVGERWDKPPAEGYVAQLAYQASPLGRSAGQAPLMTPPFHVCHVC